MRRNAGETPAACKTESAPPFQPEPVAHTFHEAETEAQRKNRVIVFARRCKDLNDALEVVAPSARQLSSNRQVCQPME